MAGKEAWEGTSRPSRPDVAAAAVGRAAERVDASKHVWERAARRTTARRRPDHGTAAKRAEQGVLGGRRHRNGALSGQGPRPVGRVLHRASGLLRRAEAG